jgi:uroporphyrinogen-III decarboxylase
MMTGKSSEELYEEREKRVRDAIALREPDRVPVVLTMNYFPARYVGELTVADSYSNYDVWWGAAKKTIMDLEPDLYSAGAGGSGLALKSLGSKLFRWAGDGLGANSMHQYIEGESLKADEYDLFLSDPGDFTLRCYLPRVWEALAPFSQLPPLQSLWGASRLPSRATPFGKPEVIKAFEALFKAGQEQEKYRRAASSFSEDMANPGYPPLTHGSAPAPFDVISDHLRGMRGAMLDMYRNPDKLIQACEMIFSRSMASGVLTLQSKRGNPKRVGSALHRGSDGFMSLKQFETFYWPTLKKLIVSLTAMGLVHVPFYEGDWAQRLKYLIELPKGKTVARFAFTDLPKAKAVLGGHTCIMGGVPHGLLQTASPQEVEEHCKNLIKNCGEGGGFILTSSTGLTNEARPENVRVMINSVKKYGVY